MCGKAAKAIVTEAGVVVLGVVVLFAPAEWSCELSNAVQENRSC